MSVNALQFILIVILSGFRAMDQYSTQLFPFQHALMCWLTGIILGDPNTGLVVGGTIQLMSMGAAGLGGSSAPDYGMAGTFMNDLRLSQDIVNHMDNNLKEDKLGRLDEHGRRDGILDYMANTVGETLAGIQNVQVAQAIVNEYRNFVKATETGADEKGNNWTEEQNALWNKIVSPYKGNTLFLDFWAMSCGPCRAGMMSQKKLVEDMKDEAVKFLYITTEDQKTSGEKWMADNNIKGEHIYITNNEWKQFETMLNFTAIPRGALVSKDGKLIEHDFHVGQFKSAELKKLAERF